MAQKKLSANKLQKILPLHYCLYILQKKNKFEVLRGECLIFSELSEKTYHSVYQLKLFFEYPKTWLINIIIIIERTPCIIGFYNNITSDRKPLYE